MEWSFLHSRVNKNLPLIIFHLIQCISFTFFDTRLSHFIFIIYKIKKKIMQNVLLVNTTDIWS